MPKPSGKPKPKEQKRLATPGRTVETREQKLISLSYDLAEKRLRAGTATSQEVTHFLKLGSSQVSLEKIKLEHENKLLEAKTEALKSQKKVEELYANALKAMRSYSGLEEELPEDET